MGKPKYDCTDCIGYCCSIYERVDVKKKDIKRIAKHFGITPEETVQRYTRIVDGVLSLKKKKDSIFEQTCVFLDQTTRLCSIYEARPATCHEWPVYSGDRCVYYDILSFERLQQGDRDFVPIVDIKVLVDDDEA